MRGSAILYALPLLGALTCQRGQSFVEPEPGLERMLEQPRVDPFAGSTFYGNGMAMRAPPAGTIPRERPALEASVLSGRVGRAYVERVPVAIDVEGMGRGRARFDMLCAACHGVVGDGRSVVAENMDIRKPPSLHDERIRAFAAGRLYQVIRLGYGLMPSYAQRLSATETWEVVAYVRALQLSRNATVAALPKAVRAELEEEAR